MGDRAQQWRPPPRRLCLEVSQIHVWRGRFRLDAAQAEIFTAHLSSEEKDRADKFIKASDRDRYVFAHGMLRSILGWYIGCRPQRIALKYNPYGKPALAAPVGAEDIRFNLAHSKDVVLVALCRTHEVGVDVEFMRPMVDLDQIIRRNFSPKERRYLGTLPADQLQCAFFIQWALKEAFIKGIGQGLSHPLEDFSVVPKAPRWKVGDFYTVIPKSGPRWECLLLSPCPGYVGALAAESILGYPKLWNFFYKT